jgi:hypothetical protein
MTTTPLHLSWYQRINIRMLIVAAVVLVPVGGVAYLILDQVITHGIHNRGGYTEVDLKQMSSFEMDPTVATDASVPPEFRELDGKRVMLVGEMFNGNSAGSHARDFDLVYSIQKCCFQGTPKVQHFVKCSTPKDKRVSYYPGTVKAVGTLHVGVQKDAGIVSSVYRMEVESIEPAQ